MSENFAKLLEESLATIDMRTGAILIGDVVAIGNDFVTVNVGLKSEAIVPIDQFLAADGTLEVKVGDKVDVFLDKVEDGFGETVLSREKAKRAAAWTELERAHESRAVVLGVITERVKGGFTVEVQGVRAFLPGSLVDVRPVRDPGYLEGKELEFKVLKIDKKRNNVVVSRRAVVEDESGTERQKLLEGLQEGQEIKGVVKNLTDYGAFVDLGGIDGLLHITDMSWKRIKHPTEAVNIGDEIMVKILKFDRERGRVSLGMKQLGDDPWADLKRRFPKGARIVGKVTNITEYGCFVEVEKGVEGLVHVSEMDWTNKNIHPSKVVQLGQEVEVMVLEIDEERRRISLGIKQCAANPWEAFSEGHKKGDKVKGQIKSITDFGIFIGLEGGIDGLIHLSDLSWNETGEEAVKSYKKGDELEAVILLIDPERERISLGVKQLSGDPFNIYAEMNPKGSVVTGKVKEVDAKAAIIELADQVEGSLKANDISREKIDDARNYLNVGDEVEAKITNIDRKNRSIVLSIKAKDVEEEAETIKKYTQSESGSTTLGDIFKKQVEEESKED